MKPLVEELNATNCKTYLVAIGDRAVLVDPVRERVETYRKVLGERQLKLELVLETHTHADHLMLSRAQREALGAPIAMHTSSPSPMVERHLRDGEQFRVGDATFEVMHTPGHTPDSVSYRIEGAVLTGDTLMINGSGRCDFPGGDAGQQYDAVTKKLLTLPDDTIVWPAHDYKGATQSTIGKEKRDNPRFLGKTREQYVELMAKLGLPFPDKIQSALQVNQSGFEPSEVEFPLVSEIASIPLITARDLSRALASSSPPLLLDVREPEEFVGELGHIEGSLLVPMDALERRLPKLAGYVDREVVLVCRAGARSASAGAMLSRAGFAKVRNLEGGMLAWNDARLPTLK